MDRLHAGAEVRREGLKTDVGHVGPHDPPRQLRRADRRALEDAGSRAVRGSRSGTRSRSARCGRRRPRRGRTRGRRAGPLRSAAPPGTRKSSIPVRCAMKGGSRRRDRRAPGTCRGARRRVPDRADLGDPRLARRATRGLEVDHHELHLPQRHAVARVVWMGADSMGASDRWGRWGRSPYRTDVRWSRKGGSIPRMVRTGTDIGLAYEAGSRKIRARVHGLNSRGALESDDDLVRALGLRTEERCLVGAVGLAVGSRSPMFVTCTVFAMIFTNPVPSSEQRRRDLDPSSRAPGHRWRSRLFGVRTTRRVRVVGALSSLRMVPTAAPSVSDAFAGALSAIDSVSSASNVTSPFTTTSTWFRSRPRGSSACRPCHVVGPRGGGEAGRGVVDRGVDVRVACEGHGEVSIFVPRSLR